MVHKNDVEQLIAHFELQPHPEGGFYRETYRAMLSVKPSGHGVDRAACTAIYYLLCNGAWSAWHRIDADEMWHFYAGHGATIHMFGADGLLTQRLGNPLCDPKASFQILVPAGRWFAAELTAPDHFVLAGCTVAPGFEFSGFELADSAVLLRDFPEHSDLINRLAAKN